MSYPVTYYCPACGTLVELQREGYLADKAVTPYPLEGWSYADPDEPFEADGSGTDGEDVDADGVRFVCGESEAGGLRWTGEHAPDGDPSLVPEGADGCGEPFYLSFVRYEDGQEVDPGDPTEFVEVASDRPSGPRGPSGPGLGF
ncbi:hypothetical protein ACFO0N_04130 [Halobium salinum]|uniref:DUF7969 domain-containing protein n=1 Tax=Halobium salinum TaxID=1364940 RepID=A0ABD5P8P6_9EURY|nr:hypothetical protein [Halobium salinum]